MSLHLFSRLKCLKIPLHLNNDSSNALIYSEGEQVICKDQIFDVVVRVRCEIAYVVNVIEEEYTNRPYILSDSEEELTENVIQGPRSKIRHNWLFQQTFETAEQAPLWIKNEGCWAAGKVYETIAGNKQPYRCNMVPKRGNQCARAVQLLDNADNLQVSLYVTAAEHTHEEIAEGVLKSGINTMLLLPLLPRLQM